MNGDELTEAQASAGTATLEAYEQMERADDAAIAEDAAVAEDAVGTSAPAPSSSDQLMGDRP